MSDTMPTAWEGDVPEKCDLCPAKIETVFVDGKVQNHTGWACMCLQCHSEVGDGLGMGHGQRYEKKGDEFVLVEG